MSPETFNRLHTLRMENDAAGFAMEEMKPRFDALAGRHENGTAPRAVVADQLFQTPKELAEQLVEALKLEHGSRILEPSAGLGRLLDALQPFQPSEVVAVEIAAACAGELYRQNRQGVQIKQRDFLSVQPSELGLFDAVAMNPPFHMRSDIKHILHALNFLKPGGKLAAICMNTHHRKSAFMPLIEGCGGSWTDIEPGAFKKEGTGTETAIVVMKRN